MEIDWPVVAEVAVAAGTMVLALFTYALARATRRLADEAVAAREAVERPWLVAYAVFSAGVLHLVIENKGRSLADGCVVTADYDPHIYQLLREGRLVSGSEIPGGTTVSWQLADNIPGVGAASYPPIAVDCVWHWSQKGDELQAKYMVDPALALPYK